MADDASELPMGPDDAVGATASNIVTASPTALPGAGTEGGQEDEEEDDDDDEEEEEEEEDEDAAMGGRHAGQDFYPADGGEYDGDGVDEDEGYDEGDNVDF